MMHRFLSDNRVELIARCRGKVALRSATGVPGQELDHGVTVFLDQLIKTLQVEEGAEPMRSRTVASKSSSKRPAATSGRWAAHLARSLAVGT